MTDLDIILLAQEHVRKSISVLEHINDEYIFEAINAEYQTLNDIQIDFTNIANYVRNGDFDAID